MTKQVIASFHRLKEAKTIDDVLDYMVFRAPKKTIDAAVFDHLLLLFFSTLPDFEKRSDFSEEEIEAFKANLPWKEIGIDGLKLGSIIKKYRSINRILDALVEEIPEEKKKEIAREHIKQFWFEKQFQGNLDAFRQAMKENFWRNPDHEETSTLSIE